MPFKHKDLTGQRFGKLVAVSSKKVGRRYMWTCLCDCGKTTVVAAPNLPNGHTKSCGCKRLKKLNFHYKKDKLAYNIWSGIKQRTTNPNCREYKWYGARGISMCQEWLESFDAFHAYVYALPRNGQSIDRIDTNGNYEPGNIRWATPKQQMNNTRANRVLEFNGRSMTVTQWAEEVGISPSALSARINRLGWSVDKALTIKLKPDKRRIECHAVQELGVEFAAI